MADCLRCWVSGRVQGVWFRASTRTQALRLGIRGTAVNLADGRVEIIACGDTEALQQLQDWLRQGPPGARVDHLVCESMADPGLTGFTTA